MTVTLDINDYIPEDVTIVGNHNTVTVQLNIEPLESLTLSVDLKDIPETGRSENYRYSFGSTYVDITVSGLAEDDIFTVTGYTPFTITVTESGPGSSGSGSDTESTEASEGSDGANDQAGSSAAEED